MSRNNGEDFGLLSDVRILSGFADILRLGLENTGTKSRAAGTADLEGFPHFPRAIMCIMMGECEYKQ